MVGLVKKKTVGLLTLMCPYMYYTPNGPQSKVFMTFQTCSSLKWHTLHMLVIMLGLGQFYPCHQTNFLTTLELFAACTPNHTLHLSWYSLATGFSLIHEKNKTDHFSRQTFKSCEVTSLNLPQIVTCN